MNRTRQSYIYAGLAVLFWSTIATVFKIGLGELEILPMLTIAAFTSMVVLLIITITGKKFHLLGKTTGKELLTSALLGFINPFLYYIILLNAYKLLPAQVAQPLNMIWPIILVFLSVPLLGQKIPGKSFAALFISFAGVYIISSQGQPFSPGRSDTTGVILATGSSILWALYFILNVKDRRDESVKLFTNFLFASAYLLLAITISGKWQSAINLKGMAAAVYLGIFEIGITFFFWLKALQLADTSAKVSNIIFLTPFFSLTCIHFFLHEPVYYTTLLGLLMIIAGIFIQNRKSKADKKLVL
jgi:drug/metabolite transporter (DMT)-like permease